MYFDIDAQYVQTLASEAFSLFTHEGISSKASMC